MPFSHHKLFWIISFSLQDILHYIENMNIIYAFLQSNDSDNFLFFYSGKKLLFEIQQKPTSALAQVPGFSGCTRLFRNDCECACKATPFPSSNTSGIPVGLLVLSGCSGAHCGGYCVDAVWYQSQ